MEMRVLGRGSAHLRRARARCPRRAARALATAALAVLAAPVACDEPDRGPGPVEETSGLPAGASNGDESDREAQVALSRTLVRSLALADSVEDLLRPVPLMRPADEARLRRYLNNAHVTRARALGVHATDDAEVARLKQAGRLVELEDSTRYWIVREGAVDDALVTPDVPPLLREIGERFQEELARRGLPPYRLEITSVLRTSAEQAALRRSNPNAASGTSSHEFGTTLDIAYEAYAPPADTPEGLIPEDAPDAMVRDLQRVAALALQSISAQKSRELKAILADVLAEMQAEGDVLVIHESFQPVFHITVARRYD